MVRGVGPSILYNIRFQYLKEYSRIFFRVVSHNGSLTRKYNKTSDIVNFDLFAPIRWTIEKKNTGDMFLISNLQPLM